MPARTDESLQNISSGARFIYKTSEYSAIFNASVQAKVQALVQHIAFGSSRLQVAPIERIGVSRSVDLG